MNDDLAYVVHMKPGDVLTVDLWELSDDPVDFYLTNLTAYLAYKASLTGQQEIDYLYFLGEGTRKDSAEINYQYTAMVESTFVVLIDNSQWTEGGADPTGQVGIRGEIIFEKNVWTWQNIAITALVIGVIIAFMAGVWIPRNKG